MENQIAIFAAGCFWHVEEEFSKIFGIIKTRVGYTGGYVENPSYKEVSSGKTGHAEAIEVTFDPKIIDYERLVEIFWGLHDPTSLNRQGADIGNNYRSAIFYKNEKQKKIAEESKKKYQRKFERPIVTEIRKATKFYPAEEYHQKYFQKNKEISCRI